MPIANYPALWNGLIELADAAPARFDIDNNGTVAASLTVQSRSVSVMQFSRTRPDAALLMIELGDVPDERGFAAWLALMDGNSVLPGSDSPRFSRNPRNGQAVMQWPCTFSQVSVHDVYERACQMVAVAHAWASDPVPAGESRAFYALSRDTSESSDDVPFPAGTAVDRFHTLYKELCESAGMPAAAPPLGDIECEFPVRFEQADVTVAHSPLRNPNAALIALHFGKMLPSVQQTHVLSMMDANFVMGLVPDGPILCRDPSGKLLLTYAYPLGTEASGQHCLAQMSGLVSMAAEWKQFMSRAMNSITPSESELSMYA